MANRLTDLHHISTLAIELGMAFPAVAKQYGVRLEGIEDDANEHNDFWVAVARHVLELPPLAPKGTQR